MNATFRNLVLMALMVGSALVAPMLRATTSLADQLPPIDLENLVPRQFGEWREQTGLAMQVVDPEMQANLDKLYSQTLSRTYVNRDGYRIMLSIAYGKDQSDALQVHKPEICYPAQGFRLGEIQRTHLAIPERPNLAATRLMTTMGQRYEPVTYWVVVGDHVTRGGIDKKLKEMSYSVLQRTSPDGMLVRFSSLDRDPVRAHQIQGEFAANLIQSIHPDFRNRFAGASD